MMMKENKRACLLLSELVIIKNTNKRMSVSVNLSVLAQFCGHFSLHHGV